MRIEIEQQHVTVTISDCGPGETRIDLRFRGRDFTIQAPTDDIREAIWILYHLLFAKKE